MGFKLILKVGKYSSLVKELIDSENNGNNLEKLSD